jgi:hypothetical protein
MTIRNTYRSEYCALINAIHRCHNIMHAAYPTYGARGIQVCPEWRSHGGFERFLEHIKPKASSNLSLERIDNEQGYLPGNVKWDTRNAQQHNTRKSRFAPHVYAAIAKASEETGLPVDALRNRLKRGWPLDQLNQPRRQAATRDPLSPARRAAINLRNADIVRLFEEGHNRKTIAGMVGLSQYHVGKIIKGLLK